MSHSGIRLIVGLGNPGPEYSNTRHNVGAWLVDRMAELESLQLKFNSKLFGKITKLNRYTTPIQLFIPDTYMNESGKAVLAIAHYYKIPPQQILIAHDELDFPAGTIRLKAGGGHGGHNGLRDITNKLRSSDFYRLRIGINHPGDKNRVSNYVLSKPNKDDQARICSAIDESVSTMSSLVSGDFEQAFRLLHSEE